MPSFGHPFPLIQTSNHQRGASNFRRKRHTVWLDGTRTIARSLFPNGPLVSLFPVLDSSWKKQEKHAIGGKLHPNYLFEKIKSLESLCVRNLPTNLRASEVCWNLWPNQRRCQCRCGDQERFGMVFEICLKTVDCRSNNFAGSQIYGWRDWQDRTRTRN